MQGLCLQLQEVLDSLMMASSEIAQAPDERVRVPRMGCGRF